MKSTLLFILLYLIHSVGFAQSITIKGTVKNAQDSIIIFQKVDKDILTGLTNQKAYRTVLKGSTFEISLPVATIEMWTISSGSFNWGAQFIAGENLDLEIDMSMSMEADFTKGMVAKGKNSANFNLVYNFMSELNNTNVETYKKLKTVKTVAEALELRKENNERFITSLAKYKTSGVTESYYKWWLTEIMYRPYERTLIEDIIIKKLPLDEVTIKKLLEKGINNDYAALNSETYNDFVRSYVDYSLREQFHNSIIVIDENIDFGIKNLSGLTRSSYLTRQMVSFSKVDSSVYNRLYKRYIDVVKDRKLIAQVDKARNEQLSSAGITIDAQQFPRLKAILEKYKGKVIYVDFWASWCGPCLAEMPNAVLLKEQLKGRDIVFLYLGFEDKEQDWMATRNRLKMEGEHYLLDNVAVSEAKALFQMTGIPHYAIINKKGEVVNKAAARPGNVKDDLLMFVDK